MHRVANWPLHGAFSLALITFQTIYVYVFTSFIETDIKTRSCLSLSILHHMHCCVKLEYPFVDFLQHMTH